MIKNNKRKPGSINTTTINKAYNQLRCQVQHDNSDKNVLKVSTKTNLFHNVVVVNQKESLQMKKKDERVVSYNEQLISIDLKNQLIEDVQSRFNKNIKLQNISSLNLSFNTLKTLPNNFFNQLKALQKLYLQNNHIQKINFPYFKQNTIQIVNLSHNKINSLNLEHLQSLIKLQCNNNQISFLTLPQSIEILDCSVNKLSNIYFMQNCWKLQEVNMSKNILYDLKFNFKPYIKFKEDRDDTNTNIKYKYMRFLDCSYNKIVYIEGMIHVINLRTLIMNDNQVSFTRHIINQITQLLNLQELYIQNNPLEGAGFSQNQITEMIISKLTKIKILNTEFAQTISFSAQKSQKKSHFSGIEDQPYNLFMDSYKKLDQKQMQIPKHLEWNFTLGDCQNQNKLTDLSQIDLINTEITQNVFDKIDYEISQKLNRQDLQQTYEKGLLNTVLKERKGHKLKLLKSSQKINNLQHIHFQPFLHQLIEMSYIPPYPILNKQENIIGKRLQEDDDEFLIIEKMFRNKGGLVYAKKIIKYHIIENGRYIFDKHKHQKYDCSLGFLLNNLNQLEFREFCKFNKLIKRNEKDIIGLQPNVFTRFHVIVRQNNHYEDEYYQAIYMIQSNHL